MEKDLVLCDRNIFIHWFNNHKPTIEKLKEIGLGKFVPCLPDRQGRQLVHSICFLKVMN